MVVNESLGRQNPLPVRFWQPQHILNGMIKVSTLAIDSSTKRTPAATLGSLNALPLGPLHSVFSLLDLKTLSDARRT